MGAGPDRVTTEGGIARGIDREIGRETDAIVRATVHAIVRETENITEIDPGIVIDLHVRALETDDATVGVRHVIGLRVRDPPPSKSEEAK